ncbi:MAG: tRNA pseudouridine(13) synthase TruD [Myxococcota bacterium]
MIRLRTEPEDFRVEEEPLYPPSGEGTHTFVRVEKRLRTTEAVARELARCAEVPARDVGYAGRKDRAAVTTQWFSVPGLDPEAAIDLSLTGARVLEAVRHPHKLRTGQLRGNRFVLRLRDGTPADWARGEANLQALLVEGLPNRFGAQRFGRDSDNAERARRYCAGELRVRDRREARFLVSAWQSEVFNAVLAARPGPLGLLEVGDLAMRHDSGAAFLVEDAAREQPRADRFEISPTGPIFGPRMTWPGGAVLERERALLRDQGLDPDALALPGVRARGARRAPRVQPEGLTLQVQSDSEAELSFGLPAGSYATVLVESLFGPTEDASAHDRPRPRA